MGHWISHSTDLLKNVGSFSNKTPALHRFCFSHVYSTHPAILWLKCNSHNINLLSIEQLCCFYCCRKSISHLQCADIWEKTTLLHVWYIVSYFILYIYHKKTNKQEQQAPIHFHLRFWIFWWHTMALGNKHKFKQLFTENVFPTY